MKKGFTLIEVMLVISLLGILGSVTTVSYKYYTTKNRYNYASFLGEDIFEAVIWSFEQKDNAINRPEIIEMVSRITNHNITISNEVNTGATKAITIEYTYAGYHYCMNIDLVSYKMNINDKEKGNKIYEN